ncbi:MAG: hypothetical protein PHE09_11815 [Oscillospiraceae bacterium]|nr:hypothetical protein [Oscillospiraceae bacterium]
MSERRLNESAGARTLAESNCKQRISLGTYEGAFPHIGEALFTQKAEHQYASFDEAFQAACRIGCKQFLADMFAGNDILRMAVEPEEQEPGLFDMKM